MLINLIIGIRPTGGEKRLGAVGGGEKGGENGQVHGRLQGEEREKEGVSRSKDGKGKARRVGSLSKQGGTQVDDGRKGRLTEG